MPKFEIKWEVEDGYAGKSRPQTTQFDSNDYMDEEEWAEASADEKLGCIDDAVQQDFEMKITAGIDYDDISEYIS